MYRESATLESEMINLWGGLWTNQLSLDGRKSLTLLVGASWPSFLVAGLTHPDRGTAPASLWHWHPVVGAGMAESLTT